MRKIYAYKNDKDCPVRCFFEKADVKIINKFQTILTHISNEKNGLCEPYVYLCQRTGIPCISIVDDTHAWNEVYVDGKWHTTDISYYDIARTDEYLFPKNYPRADINIQKTNFAKELLVPGSTN